MDSQYFLWFLSVQSLTITGQLLGHIFNIHHGNKNCYTSLSDRSSARFLLKVWHSPKMFQTKHKYYMFLQFRTAYHTDFILVIRKKTEMCYWSINGRRLKTIWIAN
jgi:hypothetical protein